MLSLLRASCNIVRHPIHRLNNAGAVGTFTSVPNKMMISSIRQSRIDPPVASFTTCKYTPVNAPSRTSGTNIYTQYPYQYKHFSTFSKGRARPNNNNNVYEEDDVNIPASEKEQEYVKAELSSVTGTDHAYSDILDKLKDAKLVCEEQLLLDDEDESQSSSSSSSSSSSLIEAMKNVLTIQWEAGMLDDAQQTGEDILSRLIKMHSKDQGEDNDIPQHMDIADIMNMIGSIQSRLNNPEEAERWYNASLEMKRSLLPNNIEYHFEIGKSLNGLALAQIQKYDDSEYGNGDGEINGDTALSIIQMLQEAMDHYVFHGDGGDGKVDQDMADHPHVASINQNLAMLYRRHEDFQMAAQKYEQALRIHMLWASSSDLEVDGSEVIMDLLMNIADCWKGLGEFDKALGRYEEALKMHQLIIRREKRVREHMKEDEDENSSQEESNNGNDIVEFDGEQSKEQGTALEAILRHNIGLMHAQIGQHEDAMAEYQSALRIKKTFGETHPEVAVTLNGIGALLASKGDGQSALAYFREALFIFRENTMVVGDNEDADDDIAQTKKNIELVENHMATGKTMMPGRNRRGKGLFSQ